MSDVNNMYVKGEAEERDWSSSSARFRSKLASLIFPNENKTPALGTIELPHENRDFKPNWQVKDYKKLDYSQMKNASPEEIKKEIEWITENTGWFHCIELGDGLDTPGVKSWQERARRFSVAENVPGKTVLDIGAMEGGDTFFAEKAGAKKVTAYDVDNYFQYDLGLNAAWEYIVTEYKTAQAKGKEYEWIFLNGKRFGFEFCKQVLQSNAERLSGSIYELDPAIHGMFDIVYCFGLFYHLRHPILALDKVYSVTKEMAFIDNQIFTGYSANPNAVLFYNDTWRGSYTNWFVPTPKTFVDMASSVGFRKIEVTNVSDTQVSLICYK